MIESLAVRRALMNFNRGKPLPRERGAKHHTFRDPITGEKAVDHRLKSPAFSAGNLRGAGKDFTRRGIKQITLVKL
jgi:hypothetical protein